MSFLKRLFGGSSKGNPGDESPMDEEGFWSLIAQASKETSDPEERASQLGRGLSAHAPEQIAAFDGIYQARIDEAYTWGLWGAAFVIRGGCSDDSFRYFRDWLISEGRETYERALHDPESLADLPRLREPENESFGYVAHSVYREKTGGEIPYQASSRPEVPAGGAWEPSGEPWEEDEVDRLYPRLAKIYG